MNAQGSSNTREDFAPCTGSLCTDPEVFKVCSNGVNSISTALCKQASAVCCIDQNFHGFGRCNHECSADAITAWKASTQQGSASTYTDYAPCSGSTCDDPEVFKVCSDGLSSISTSLCRQAAAKCCIDQDFHGFGRCNRECSADAIDAWKASQSSASSSSYTDFAPCTGNLCNDPEVFKVCSNGLNAISNSLCRQASAVCCIDQDFHGFGRCNRECTTDTIATWKSANGISSGSSSYTDYAPCTGAMCGDSDVFKVCSNGLSSISPALCKQATAKCCIDQDFHGFGRCNRECTADSVSEWKAMHASASGSTYTDYAPCTGSLCNDPEVFKVCSNGINALSNTICKQADAKCCIDQDFHGLTRCNHECSSDAISQWKAAQNTASGSAYVDYAPCTGALCTDSEVFKVCSNGANSISPALCQQASAQCCLDQDFHGFGRCNRECTVDTIAEWKSAHVVAGTTYTDFAPCTGSTCNDPEVFKVCSDGLSAISTSLCKQANAKCCIDQDFHGFGRCNHECSADAITAWKSANSVASDSSTYTDYEPCSGSICNDPEVFVVCSNGANAISNELCRQAAAKCCIDQDFHGFGRCNRECNSDAIAAWKTARSEADASSYSHSDYAPCTGSLCSDADVFKVCSDGVSAISTSLCKQASAVCCLDQDFHGFGRCNRECNADTISLWKSVHMLGSSSSYTDYAPCSSSTCNDPEVFKVCSDGVSSISTSLCRQANAKCCIDQDFHGFGRCNRECSADTIAAWKSANNVASGSSAYVDYAPCSGSTCDDSEVFKVCSDGASSISTGNCAQSFAKCCIDQNFHGFGRCNRECSASAITQWKSAHSSAASSATTRAPTSKPSAPGFAPCMGSVCSDTSIFKTCTNGKRTVACAQATALCCMYNDFRTLGSCNRECSASAIADVRDFRKAISAMFVEISQS